MEKTYLFLLCLALSCAITLLPNKQATAQENTSLSMLDTYSQNERGQQSTQRGINQSRDSRLILQLDGLTEEQIQKIDELNKKHQDQVAALRDQRQRSQANREDLMARRRAYFEQHQEELQEVLTKAQWEQLQELRADRRNAPRGR